MFEIVLKSEAVRALRKMRRFHATAIVDPIERNLRIAPEKTSSTSIERLRGRQRSVFRLKVGEHRVFHDVSGGIVEVVAILHTSETAEFCKRGQEP